MVVAYFNRLKQISYEEVRKTTKHLQQLLPNIRENRPNTKYKQFLSFHRAF
jgi:hypothetical protein